MIILSFIYIVSSLIGGYFLLHNSKDWNWLYKLVLVVFAGGSNFLGICFALENFGTHAHLDQIGTVLFLATAISLMGMGILPPFRGFKFKNPERKSKDFSIL